jgi:hypothetical protein
MDERKDRKQMTKDRQSPGAGGRCISVSIRYKKNLEVRENEALGHLI